MDPDDDGDLVNDEDDEFPLDGTEWSPVVYGFFFYMIRVLRSRTPFPYRTLFRSNTRAGVWTGRGKWGFDSGGGA